MEDNIEQLRKEVDHWKTLYNQQLAKTRQLEQQLGKRSAPNKQSSPQPANPPPPATHPPPQPAKKEDPERENILTKLRLACSQNDQALLEEAISEAEALGMEEVQYARRKLDSLLAKQ